MGWTSFRRKRGNESGRSEDGTKGTSRQLWGRDFSLVEGRLSEEEVIRFVNDLIAKQRTQLEQSTESWPQTLSKRILAETERDAANLRIRAKQEAEAEASRLITEARQEAQLVVSDARQEARTTAEQEGRSMMEAANQRAQLAETHALQKAHLFLIRARQEVEERLAVETKESYSRLMASLQDLVSTARQVESDWASRKIEPSWGGASELMEYQTTILDSLMPGGLDMDPVPTEEEPIGSATATHSAEPAVAEVVETAEESNPAPVDLPAEAPTQAAPPLETITPETITEEPLPQVSDVETQVADETPEREGVTPQAPEATADKPREEPIAAPEGAPAEDNNLSDAVAGEVARILEGETATPESESSVEEEISPAESAGGPRVYTGEVELVINPPINAARVTELYSHLQTLSEVRVVRTSGSWDRGTVVTISLERPLALIEALSELSSLEVAPAAPGSAGIKGLGDKKGYTQRVTIVFAQDEAEAEAEVAPDGETVPGDGESSDDSDSDESSG